MDSWPSLFPQSHPTSQSLDSGINLKNQEIINVKMYQRYTAIFLSFFGR
jgi:hypothetical protein